MSNISIIESAVTSLDSLLVYPIPSKAIKNVTAIRIDRTVVLIDGKGRLYSTQVQGRFSFGAGENRESIRNTITGAARLGAISKAAMEEDLQFRQAAHRRVPPHQRHGGISSMTQLALFEAPSGTTTKPEASTHRHIVLARLGASGLTNFAWWCRHGNREMCAAVLWKENGFTKAGANSAVLELSGESSHG